MTKTMSIDSTRRSEGEPESSNSSGYDQQERIRKRAYELYEQRGRQDGFHEQDWKEAENEIRAKSGMARAA